MRAALAIACGAAALSVGCAGPSTFVSPDPPDGAQVDTWFPRPMERVRSAIAQSMSEARLSITVAEGGPTVVAAEKHQLPYIAEDAGAPPTGPLPVYRMRAILSPRSAGTHVRVTVEPSCPACNGTTPYEWEYPVDLIRDVLERTRSALGHRGPRIDYPPRFVPRRRRP